MHHHLTVKGTLETSEVRAWIERPLGRLTRRLIRFPQDALHLGIVAREFEGKPHAEANVTLRLPSNTLSASEEAGDARSAIDAAFHEIERLLDKEKSRLRRANHWRDSADDFRRELLERVARERVAPDDGVEAFRPVLEELERFVVAELTWLEASGDLVPGELDPRDVVDAAFVRAMEHVQDAKPGEPPSRAQLLQSASATLRRELERTRAQRQEVHFEATALPVPPEKRVSTLGSEMLDFHQADADLRVGDLIAGLGDTPEQFASSAEVAVVLQRGLRALPGRWRQAFQLRHIEEFDDEAIARTLELECAEVPRLVEQATVFLRHHLEDAGVASA